MWLNKWANRTNTDQTEDNDSVRQLLGQAHSHTSFVFICVAAEAAGLVRGFNSLGVAFNFLTTSNFSVFCHQFAPTHPFLHSFPQSILTFPCFNWQKGKGEG